MRNAARPARTSRSRSSRPSARPGSTWRSSRASSKQMITKLPRAPASDGRCHWGAGLSGPAHQRRHLRAQPRQLGRRQVEAARLAQRLGDPGRSRSRPTPRCCERDADKRKAMYEEMQTEFRKTRPFMSCSRRATRPACARTSRASCRGRPSTSSTTAWSTKCEVSAQPPGSGAARRSRRMTDARSHDRAATARASPRIAVRAWHGCRFGRCSLTFLGLLAVTFFIGRVRADRPGAGRSSATARRRTSYDRVRDELGLDQPLWEQFWHLRRRSCCTAISARRSSPRTRCSRTSRASSPRRSSWRRSATIIGVALRRAAWACWPRRDQGRWPTRSCASSGCRLFDAGLLARPGGLSVFYGKLGWVGGPAGIDVAL